MDDSSENDEEFIKLIEWTDRPKRMEVSRPESGRSIQEERRLCQVRKVDGPPKENGSFTKNIKWTILSQEPKWTDPLKYPH